MEEKTQNEKSDADVAREPVRPGEGATQVDSDELQEFLTTLRQYLRPVTWAVLFILVITLAVWGYRKRMEAGRLEASAKLFMPASVDEIDRASGQYASTPVAPLLALRAAKAHYASGNYAMALSKYDAFLKTYPGHLMTGTAEMGRLNCLEAMGRQAEALPGYTAFATSSADHYLLAHAVLGRGRCLQSLGQAAEARVVYEDFLAAHAASPWKFLVEESLELIRGERKGISGSLTNAVMEAVAPIPETVVEKD